MMSRKILFRAKRKDNNEWVYGCGVYNDGVMAFIINYAVDLVNETSKFEHIQVIPETVGQYTRLDDKNGVKIFKGDIVKATEYLKPGEVELYYKVDYIERLARYVFNPIIEDGKYNNNNFELDVYFYSKEDIEVVRSIHDNPELLDSKEVE